jgi:hypothetical protein
VKSGAGELIVEDILHKIRRNLTESLQKKFINVLCFVEKEVHMRRDII